MIRPALPAVVETSIAMTPRQRGVSCTKLLSDLQNGSPAHWWQCQREIDNSYTVAKAGAGFKSLADAWADTTTAHGRLMLTVLGGLAEFERALIIARTGDGRVRAKARGVRFGRPPALTSHQRQEAIQRLAEGATQADLARTYGVSQATISRLQPLPFEHASVAGA